jgi:hypothetical protein
MDKEIRIIRMITGEDIVASMEGTKNNDSAIVRDPMRIVFRRLPNGKSILMLAPWLPIELLENNETEIYSNDILTIMTPKAEFIEYYENLLLEEQNAFLLKDEMFRDELTKLSESLQEDSEDEFVMPEVDKKLLH